MLGFAPQPTRCGQQLPDAYHAESRAGAGSTASCSWPSKHDNADVNAFVASQTALGRAGLPDDIGGVVAMLLAKESGWINAQRIEASGGMFV